MNDDNDDQDGEELLSSRLDLDHEEALRGFMEVDPRR